MKPKILLIDDNITVIKIISTVLQTEGYEVFSTTDSAMSLVKAHETIPDLILLDIVMPEPNGFEICRLLKADPILSGIPVIILTAETDSRDLEVAMELGAIDYIRKPADKIELLARVRSACRIKQYQDKLKDMAARDGLTGLYNHAALIQRFSRKYGVQALKGGDISFIMVDIDYFKKINDTYGHLAGDTILKEVSCILSWSFENPAVVSRYGGEEFGIFIPDMPSQSVMELCESLRLNIEGYKFPVDEDNHINVTVSIGFCAIKAARETDCNEIIQKADDALYSAKKNGRNRVVKAS